MMNAQAAAIRQAGFQLLKAGRPRDAVQTLQQSAGLDPESYDTYAYLGAAYAQLQEFDSARRAFGRAVQLQPSSAKARFNLGSAHQMAGDSDAARTCFEAALELDDDYRPAREALEKLPPKVVSMSELASPGASIHMPGAVTTTSDEPAQEFTVSHLTPQEIAQLSMPKGHIHLTGAQASEVLPHEAPRQAVVIEEGEDEHKEAPEFQPSHLTPEEIARLSMPQGHLHMMGAQAADDSVHTDVHSEAV